MSNQNKIFFGFFGTSDFSVIVLETLKEKGFEPNLIVTTPDKPKGRKLIMAPSPVKIWAKQNKINVCEPDNLKDPSLSYKLKAISYKLFVVASYGKIMPKEILSLPKSGTLNVHPSLLPKLRGPSPIQTAILNDEKDIGVTIMLMDELVDHGAVVAQEKVVVPNWPPKEVELEKILGKKGGALLADVIPKWLAGEIKPEVQDESLVTWSKKILKEDGLIDLSGDPHKNYLKIQAFSTWPGTFFFIEKGNPKNTEEIGVRASKQIRVVIKKADFKNGKLEIKRVIPEGKKEMSYEDFLKGLKR